MIVKINSKTEVNVRLYGVNPLFLGKPVKHFN